TILLGTPYRMRREKFHRFGARCQQKFFKYKKKSYPIFSPGPSVTKLITYQVYPLSSALEALAVVRQVREKDIFSRIKSPVFIAQAARDHLIERDSLRLISKKLRTNKIICKTLQGAYHNFIADRRQSHIYADILNFANRVRKKQL
ncbi:MAG TPA: hypothetical protein ENJ77_00290, partial [Candidatus Moranbacteria bacterium]|nr:hypothetical protein [Candidatus Moranbacteria bacterium]